MYPKPEARTVSFESAPMSRGANVQAKIISWSRNTIQRNIVLKGIWIVHFVRDPQLRPLDIRHVSQICASHSHLRTCAAFINTMSSRQNPVWMNQGSAANVIPISDRGNQSCLEGNFTLLYSFSLNDSRIAFLARIVFGKGDLTRGFSGCLSMAWCAVALDFYIPK